MAEVGGGAWTPYGTASSGAPPPQIGVWPGASTAGMRGALPLRVDSAMTPTTAASAATR